MSLIWGACMLIAVGRIHQSTAGTCPGTIHMEGYGPISLVNAEWNMQGDKAGAVEVTGESEIAPRMKGRTYFANECSSGNYSNTDYAALKLLGKTMKYTVDLSGASCGCNAALYLTSLPQNPSASNCLDYYCDANSVCGVACAEIDIQEANDRAWHSTLHTWDDGAGMASVVGYGGNQARDWNAAEYGPGANCIDTSSPFEVAVSFPVDGQGKLSAMEIVLSQPGHSCPLSTSISGYQIHGRDGMADMTQVLRDGMTPIISYWSSNDMLWMDGLGSDYQGPCASDNAAACPESVRFYNFSLEEIPAPSLQTRPFRPHRVFKSLRVSEKL